LSRQLIAANLASTSDSTSNQLAVLCKSASSKLKHARAMEKNGSQRNCYYTELFRLLPRSDLVSRWK
jgi:hypothetical protein